jgi:magnesium-transporting ATPase (P-type)
MNQYYNQSTEDVLKQYNVSVDVGLSSEEAEKRLAEYGLNELAQQKQKGLWTIFFEQFKSTIFT